MNWYLAKLGSLDEKRACPSHLQNLQNPSKRGFDGFEGRSDDPYVSALAALRANCPAYVPEDRWRRAITDATAFISEWGAQARRSAGRRVSCSAYTPRLSDRWQAIGD